MPEYLAPGVFVEETSFRQKTIEGASTSITGFIGPARTGPVCGEPALLTSFAAFTDIYGGLDPLDFGSGPRPNYLAFAVRAYFDEGGRQLYVSRVTGGEPAVARWEVSEPSSPGFAIKARYPGAGGNGTVALSLRFSGNVLRSGPDNDRVLQGVRDRDTVVLRGEAPASRTLAVVTSDNTSKVWSVVDDHGESLSLADWNEARVISACLLYRPDGLFSREQRFDDLAFDPGHARSLSRTLSPGNLASAQSTPFAGLVFESAAGQNGAAIALAFLREFNQGRIPEKDAALGTLSLTGGTDGALPGPGDYEGEADDPLGKSGLAAFRDLKDISIVAAPGSTARDIASGDARRIRDALVTHCEKMLHRIAVLDSIQGDSPGQVRSYRSQVDSTHAALYYPWVRVSDPTSRAESVELELPPSGFVCGIYARNDIQRGVHKAPANESIRSALGFTFPVNAAQQEWLNPIGVNCLRSFEGRGHRVWGARTASSDPEWQYVNVRRYFDYIERSIERGTQWVVFEPNEPALWSNVQRCVENFLHDEFVSDRLAGSTPQEAFFVRCDETTMTQSDRDNGRLVCLVGAAPLRPAEFVIFRIGQMTGDTRAGARD